MPAFGGVGRGLVGGIPGAAGAGIPGQPGGVVGQMAGLLRRKSKKGPALTPEQQAAFEASPLGRAAGVTAQAFGRSRPAGTTSSTGY